MGKHGGLLYGGIIGASNRVCPQGQLCWRRTLVCSGVTFNGLSLEDLAHH